MTLKTMIAAAAVMLATTSAQAGSITSFDGAAKAGGSPQLGTGGTANGPDVYGQILNFLNFNVTSGYSPNTNLAGNSFNTGQIVTNTQTSGVYQDISPIHGGLGAFTKGGTGDTDNLDPNLNGNSNTDEVLFFTFNSSIILETVWFNGSHTEFTGLDVNGPNDTMFNIFSSTDGINYTSIIGGQQIPTNLDYISTSLVNSYQYYAVAASGYGSASGGYIEAIGIPEPATMALLGLGLLGLGYSRKSRKY